MPRTRGSAVPCSGASGPTTPCTSTTRCRTVSSDMSEPKMLGEQMLVRMVATEGAEQRYSGTDVVEFGSDGRIVRVTNFYDD
jgi:hypothetical protein